MNKIMKNLFFLTIACVSFLITSCDLTNNDFLGEENHSETLDTYLNTAAGFESGINACYSYLRNWYGRPEDSVQMSVNGTDEMRAGFGADLAFSDYDISLNGSYGGVNTVWNLTYQGINACNAPISRAPEVDMDESLKNIRVAEARFIRGLFYYKLVSHWGPVHITLEETQGVQTEATRSPVSEVFDVIIADMQNAVDTLPDQVSDYGRVSKPAAEALLSKVLLANARHTQSNDDYANAAALAESVINNYHYRLLDNFEDIFAQDNQENDEIILAVQNSLNPLTTNAGFGQGNHILSRYLPRYERVHGLQWSQEYGRTGSAIRPTLWVLNELWDDEIDVREDATLQRLWLTNDPGTGLSLNGHEITLAVGDTALYMPKEIWSEERIEQAGFSVLNPDVDDITYLYPGNKKFLANRVSVNTAAAGKDVIVIRLAEVHLLAAEAYVRLGNLDAAAEHVNVVRRRAAQPGEEAAMEVTSNQMDIDFILDERAKELHGELTRWEDLTRTEKLLERVERFNPEAAQNIQPYHMLRPIPQDQIDRTTTPFAQNPGYPGAN